ncbi:MAG: glycosyltransferase family 87 protein [Anaerolineae bacterium]
MSLTDRLSTWAQARWLRWLLVAALVMLYTGWIGYQVVRNELYDFNLYYIAAAGFRQGVDIYALAREYTGANQPRWAELAVQHGVEYYAPPYRYPPLTAQLVLPLTLLPPKVAGSVWIALTAVTFIVSAWLLGKSSHLPYGVPLSHLLLFLFVPPLTTMHAGQINGFLLLALSLAVYSLARRDWIGTGVGLALGTLLKLIPLALVLYLPWRRLWKATIIAVIVIVALLLTVPLTLGPGTLQAYARYFFTIGQPGTVFATPPNQSLNGFWGRLLINQVDSGVIYRIYLVSAMLVMLCTLACCWPGGAFVPHWRIEFALIVCALQLITPYTWYHQLVLLLLPLLVLACEIVIGHAPRWWLAPLAIGFLLTDLHGLLWHHITPTLLLSTPFYTIVMLWGMLAWLTLREKWNRSDQRDVG